MAERRHQLHAGLSCLWFSVTMIIVVAFMYRYVASPFRRRSEELGSLTIVDHIAVYFEDERMGSLIRLVATLAWVSFALGIGQPPSLIRFQAIDSKRIVSAASVITVTFQSLRLTVPLFIGAAGRVPYESLDPAEAENVAMMAIVDLFPTLIAGILLAAIVSAILSTSDSMLLVTSANVTRFYESAINPDTREHKLIVLGRAVVGVVIAYTRPGTIFEIIEFAYRPRVTFGIPMLFIPFWERTALEAVLTGLIVGLTSSIGSLYLLPELDPITP